MMTLRQLQDLVEKCTRADTSPFYRKLYGMGVNEPAKNIRSIKEWQLLPLFSKEHLVDWTLQDRVFRPWSNIDTVLASSGTSGKPPVYSPWTLNNGYAYRAQYHDFKKATLSSMPTPHQQATILSQKPFDSSLVVLDPRRSAASICLAQAAGVDSMLVILHHIPLVAEEMVRMGMNENIRFIEIAGETCSHSSYAYMKKMFPNATITSIYGSTDVETSPIGIPCRPITGEDPLEVYHEGERTHLEIVDIATGKVLPIEPGVEGDLIITAYAGETATFPLIRYRIGDTVRVVEKKCAEHGAWSFTVLGRTEMDFLKIPGGILRADEMQRVLRTFGDVVSDRFELHRFERETENGLKVQVELRLQTEAGIDLDALSKDISKHFHVSAAYTYDDGVQEGFYLPLICTPLPPQQKAGKHIRMVQH